MTIPEKPKITVVSGIGEHSGYFLIAAEYLSGYEIIGVYKTLADAREALPIVKRRLRDEAKASA